MRNEEPDRLGGVDRAAASDSDQSIATRVAITIQTGMNVRLGGVGLDLAEDDRLLSQRADDLRDQTSSNQTGISHHQRASDTEPRELPRNESAGTSAEEDAVRKCKYCCCGRLQCGVCVRFGIGGSGRSRRPLGSWCGDGHRRRRCQNTTSRATRLKNRPTVAERPINQFLLVLISDRCRAPRLPYPGSLDLPYPGSLEM